MNNNINPAYGAPAAPIAPLDMGSPVRDQPQVAHAPPPIEPEYLQKKRAMREEMDARLAAARAAGAPEPAKRKLDFQGS